MRLRLDEQRALNSAMDRYADGEDAAFAEVYDLLAPRLHAFFSRKLSSSRAEDAVQQTFLQLHVARRSYVTGSELLPWAFAIARNVFRDSLRRSLKEGRLADSSEAPRDQRESNPDAWMVTKEMAGVVHAELRRLPASHREAYDLVRAGGLSASQAALVLGTTRQGVKLRVHRVYAALRRALQRMERPSPRRTWDATDKQNPPIGGDVLPADPSVKDEQMP